MGYLIHIIIVYYFRITDYASLMDADPFEQEKGLASLALCYS